MQTIFIALHGIHPLLPAAWLVVFGQGVLVPGFYCAFQRLPYDIGLIWSKAKAGQPGAKLVIASWLASAVAVLLSIAAIVLR